MFERTHLAALCALVLGIGCGADDHPVTRTDAYDRCGACHVREYRRARRPPHVGYKPATCAVCHVETAWRPAIVNHLSPLTGAHATADCFGCHRGEPTVFLGTPTACVSCHAEDARAVRSPSHARFSTVCTECHTTQAWSPTRRRQSNEHREPPPSTPATPTPAATTPARPPLRPSHPAQPPRPAPAESNEHPESRFPIARGDHAGISCQRCHRLPGPDGRDNTDCVQCHPRSRWDDVHAHVARYPQGSAAPNFCVLCHRRGTRSRR